MNSPILKLDKPPIIDVIIGVQFDNLFGSNEQINKFIETAHLKDSYPNVKDFSSVNFEVSNTPKIIKNGLKSIVLTSEDKLESIHIEFNKIMFSDKHEYSKFDDLESKFNKILSSLISFFNNQLTILGLGLRYINRFNLPIENMDEYFKILPNIDCKGYAGIKNYIAISNLISNTNLSIEANIKTIFTPISGENIQVVFDINTIFRDEFVLENIDNWKNKINELREFKNNIFFNNFINIEKMEAFK